MLKMSNFSQSLGLPLKKLEEFSIFPALYCRKHTREDRLNGFGLLGIINKKCQET